MPSRKQKDHEEIAATLRAARLFARESDTPATSEEAAMIKEVRDELPRPSKADLAALARKIMQR